MSTKNILVTGCAGFIGMHVTQKLLEKGFRVIGIDNLNDYYDVNLKRVRLNLLKKNKNFFFYKKDLKKKENIYQVYKKKNSI